MPIKFSLDRKHATYDPDAVRRFFQILVNADRVFKQFRTGFLGKASPVHFFWGSFDLAVTRFSGRRAPRHPGGVPNLPDAVACEAYSHEECSAGFWPGSGAIDYPAFYSYAYPEPRAIAPSRLRPDAAFFSEALGEFILPYDAVRTADDPDKTLLEFLQSTYEAAADTAKWDRDDAGMPARPAGRGAAGMTSSLRATAACRAHGLRGWRATDNGGVRARRDRAAQTAIRASSTPR